MLPSGSDARPLAFVVVGNPDGRRVTLFQEALARLDLPAARVVPYVDLLSGQVSLPDVVPPGAVVRIESPGKDFEVERLLLAAGADAAKEEGAFAYIPRDVVEQLPFDKGRLLYPRQWHLGFCEVLRQIKAQLALCPAHHLMNAPEDIWAMFDKRLCHARMVRNGVAVPRSLGPVTCFDDLRACMQESGYPRVFVKLAHGSSASGVVAYQVNGHRHHATTTVETARQGDELRLYNTRRIRVHRDVREIAALIDALCQHRVHVEQWIPKAMLEGQAFDLRVVMVGSGAPAATVTHVVVRQSRSPMTNLHLLNDRGDVESVLARLDPEHWDAARRTCAQAMACFPNSMYAGIDLLITPDYRHHAVLEINAFGDLLPGVLYQGRDTYETEIMAMLDAGNAKR